MDTAVREIDMEAYNTQTRPFAFALSGVVLGSSVHTRGVSDGVSVCVRFLFFSIPPTVSSGLLLLLLLCCGLTLRSHSSTRFAIINQPRVCVRSAFVCVLSVSHDRDVPPPASTRPGVGAGVLPHPAG